MGGITNTPKPVVVAPPAPLPDTSGDEEEQARLDAMERRRRGRSGTIHTSARGLVQTNENAAQKKSLLGE